MLKDHFKYLKTTHSFHLVDPSPWPAVASLGAFMITSGLVLYMHKFIGGWNLFISGFLLVFYVMYTWWRDVVREATFEEQHTVAVQKGLRLGMILFIVSEVMFFFAFFWAFFHSSIAPVYNIGGVWPPKAITPMDTYTIPLTNTFFLLTSGATVTWAHHALVARAKKQTLLGLIFTLILATLFTSLQGLEYVEASFNISDGVYGSCFYMATGFHGFHVFVGTIALLVSFVRIVFNHFTDHHHFGFESSIWYWHFVDVVWLFLFINVYWWSNNSTSSSTVPPLLNKGKLSVISWVFTRLSNSEFLIMGFYILIDIFLIWASLAIFFMLYYSNRKIKDKINDILKFFFDLPIINKLFLVSFTISIGIPNRVFINNNINSYLIFFIVTCLFFIMDELPFVTLILIFYFFLALESWLFAYLYENDVYKFQKFVNTYLFANNREFAQKFFFFFWGNMDKAGKAALKSGVAGVAARTVWNAVTGNEDLQAQAEAERRVAKATQSATGETSVQEALDATEKEKEKIMKTNAPFTNAEKKAKKFVKKKFSEITGQSESNEEKK